MKFLFYPKGRVSRKQMWLLYTLPLLGIWATIILSMFTLLGPSVLVQFFVVFVLLWAWPTISVNIKRFHDLGWPAWRVWVLAALTGPVLWAGLISAILIRTDHTMRVSQALFASDDLARDQVVPDPLTVADFWLPIFLVSVALLIYLVWTIIVLFLPGNRGDNRYGPDPRDPDAGMVDAFG